MGLVLDENEVKWQHIQDDKIYIINLYYIVGDTNYDEEPLFLYGYALEGDEGLERRKHCELTSVLALDNTHIWRLEQTITGLGLRNLICGMEQHITIKVYLSENGFELHSDLRGEKKKEIEEKISCAYICHKNSYYRPDILLIPKQESIELSSGSQPLHSYGEDVMNCESLICRNKRILYTDSEGMIDTEKMKLIHDFFKAEGFLINGTKDLCRIGDFEVFSMPIKNVSQDELFSVDPVVEETEQRSRIMTGYKVTVFCKYLRGEYMIQTASHNSGNPTSYKTCDIVISDKDVVRTVNLPESSTTLEVWLFEKHTSSRFQLIGYKKRLLIRNINMSFNIIERDKTTLEDNYTKKAKASSGNKKNAFNDKIERYTSSETRIKNDDNDPWSEGFYQVECDFNEMYGTETAESVFFDKGLGAHEEFLTWLKRSINARGIKSVWIFDPYIDNESIPRLLRALSDMGVKLKIVTDKNAPSRDKDNRIKKLKISCKALEELMPRQFEVYAFENKSCILHDRVIVMFGKQYMPIVYNLSNSLDNMGMRHPSIICKLSREAGQQAAQYYLKLFSDMDKQGYVETLYKQTDSVVSRSVRTVLTEEEKQKRLSVVVKFFNDRLISLKLPLLSTNDERIIFPNDISIEEEFRITEVICNNAATSWDKLAYIYAHMTFDDGNKIIEQLKRKYDHELGITLQKILLKSLNDKTDNASENSILKVTLEKDFREILVMISRTISNSFYREFAYTSFEFDLAFDILAMRDFSKIKEIFERVYNTIGFIRNLNLWRRLFFRIVMVMDIYKDESDNLAIECIKSEIDYLEALGMQYFIKKGIIDTPIAIIQDGGHRNEFFRAALIELQIEGNSKGYRTNQVKALRSSDEEFVKKKNIFLCKIHEVKQKWVESLPEFLTSEQLKKSFEDIDCRSCNDIIELVIMLLNTEKISMDEAEDYLIYCLFKKVENDYKIEEGTWLVRDFVNGELFLDAFAKYCTESGRKSIMRKLQSYEKKIVRCLHDPFLRQKNYRKWKSYIEMMIWCYAMRLICKNIWQDYRELAATDRNLQKREIEIYGLLKKHQKVLERNSEAYRILVETISDFM